MKDVPRQRIIPGIAVDITDIFTAAGAIQKPEELAGQLMLVREVSKSSVGVGSTPAEHET
jgi:hypothetical protein